jgi:hypothetical protein
MQDESTFEPNQLLGLPTGIWIALFIAAGGVGFMQWLFHPHSQMTSATAARITDACAAQRNCNVALLSVLNDDATGQLVPAVLVTTNASAAERQAMEASLRSAYGANGDKLRVTFNITPGDRSPKRRPTSN